MSEGIEDKTVETIREVKEYRGERPQGWGQEAGFQIVTDKQTITLAIDDQASCCEHWGYFLTEDDIEKFIGAELRGLRVTDTNRSSKTFENSIDLPDESNVYISDGDTLFVDIETDRGILQFVAYNAHNGYYGHEARVSSTQLEHSVTL